MTPHVPDLTDSDIASLLPTVLTMPAPGGARVVALHWLHAMRSARDGWEAARENPAPDDSANGTSDDVAQALHKMRVALRRLRSTLREHDKPLRLHTPRAMRHALRRLGSGTNDSRDRDVQHAWLDAHTEQLSAEARSEAEQLRRHVDAGAKARAVRVARLFSRHFDANVGAWLSWLSHYETTIHVGRTKPVPSFAVHLATMLQRGIAAISADLDAVRADDDVAALHRLRIKLKRQRAMLSPFTDRHPALGAWFDVATEGQDLLGAMRDATLLAERADADDCRALAKAASSQADEHLQAFRSRWIERRDHTLQVAHDAVVAMGGLGASSAEHAATQPAVHAELAQSSTHGLPMEIERKFLLHGLPPRAAMAATVRIEQGWLPGTVLRERLRRTTGADGSVRHTRTIKLGQMGARIEVEEPTDEALFDALWPLTVDARIRKRRHVIPEGDLTWEIDLFLDRDLVLAEVELRDTAQAVEIPSWLAPFVVREVTLDPAYLNSVLAQHTGAPESPRFPRRDA